MFYILIIIICIISFIIANTSSLETTNERSLTFAQPPVPVVNALPGYIIVQDCPEGQHKDIVAPRCERDKPCPDDATPKLGCIPNKQLTIIPSVGCKSGYTKLCPKGDQIWYNQTVLKKTNPSACICTNGKESHPFPYE